MKAIKLLKKIRGWKVEVLFQEVGLTPEIIKEIDEALEQLETLTAKANSLKRYNIEEDEKAKSIAMSGGVYYGISVERQKKILQEIEELIP